MNKKINLSEKTQQLIQQYLMMVGENTDNFSSLSSTVDQEWLVNFLQEEPPISLINKKETRQEIEFFLITLRVELLRDLLLSLNINSEVLSKIEDSKPHRSYVKFYLLAIAGTILAACEGFDSITTLLSVLNLPAVLIFMAGLFFSALSVMVFYGFNLVQVAKNLDIKLQDAPKLLDLHLLELTEIKNLRKKINSIKLSKLSIQELENLTNIISMLETRLHSLGESSKQFKMALESSKMVFAKSIFGAAAGLLFFGSGFFAGQSVGVFLFSLFLASVTPTCLPVILFAATVGLAAFSLYWYVEKVGLQQLISGWFGLDEEKIEQLCSQEQLDKQIEKLEYLKEKIIETSELVQQIKEVEAQGKAKNKDIIQPSIYSFHRTIKKENKAFCTDPDLSLRAMSLS